MASFGSATFRYRGNGGASFPIWDGKELIAEKPRPNESAITQDIGADVQRQNVVVRCTQAELIALYDQVCESGSLILGWETHDAFLEDVDGAFRVVSGIDQYEATLKMIRL